MSIQPYVFPPRFRCAHVGSEVCLWSSVKWPQNSDIQLCTHIYIFLLQLRDFSALWLVLIDQCSLQPDVVQRVLIGDIDILLCRHQFDLYMLANALDGTEIDGLHSVGAFRTPRQIVSDPQRSFKFQLLTDSNTHTGVSAGFSLKIFKLDHSRH